MLTGCHCHEDEDIALAIYESLQVGFGQQRRNSKHTSYVKKMFNSAPFTLAGLMTSWDIMTTVITNLILFADLRPQLQIWGTPKRQLVRKYKTKEHLKQALAFWLMTKVH